jgi:hypothetical protein
VILPKKPSNFYELLINKLKQLKSFLVARLLYFNITLQVKVKNKKKLNLLANSMFLLLDVERNSLYIRTALSLPSLLF